MRIKLNFLGENNAQSMPYVLALSKNIVNFHDLHQYILSKFPLQNKSLIFKTSDNFNILLSESINSIILNEDSDIINVEIHDINSKKRTFQQFLNEDLPQIQEKSCDLCGFVEKFARIKGILSEKILEKSETNKNYLEDICELQNKINFGKTEIEQTSQIKKQEKQIFIKEKNPKLLPEKPLIQEKKAPLSQEKKGIVDTTNSVIQPKKNVLFEKKKEILSSSSESSSESEISEPKKKLNTSSQISQIQKPLIQKKASDNVLSLKLQDPEEEFAKKKAFWAGSQLKNKEKEHLNNLPKNKVEVEKKPIAKREDFLSVDKKFLEYYEQTKENQGFFKVGDFIKYKIYELCPIKFSPIVSNFLYGKILEIHDKKVLSLKNEFTEETKQYSFTELIEIFIHNSSLNEERKSELLNFNKASNIVEKNSNENKQKNIKNEYSKEDFIAKQVNFYFSDKSYYKDDFIQAHIKKSEEKYFPAKLLLNFPKIKAVTQDLTYLVEILREFREKEKEKGCNFDLFENENEEINIRKKINP